MIMEFIIEDSAAGMLQQVLLEDAAYMQRRFKFRLHNLHVILSAAKNLKAHSLNLFQILRCAQNDIKQHVSLQHKTVFASPIKAHHPLQQNSSMRCQIPDS